MRPRLPLLLVLSFATLAFAAERSAQAQGADKRAEALQHFEIGFQLVDRKAWAGALAQFLRSRALFPTKSAIKNAAICLRELHRFDEALDMYDELMASYRSELSADERRAAEEDMARIARFTGSLTVSSDPPGATVVVDGRERGVTPLASLRVSVGTRSIGIHKEGHAPFEVARRVTSGETRAVEAKLAAVARLGRLRVSEASGRAFEVRVDAATVGTTPWEGTLGAGAHTVALRPAPGLELGTTARSVVVTEGKTTELALVAAPLTGELSIEPSPSDARVRIDGREVATGSWVGTLVSGPHVVEVGADWHVPERREALVSSRGRRALRPVLEPVRRLYVELFGGGTPPGGYGVENGGACDALCMGGLIGLRGGYMLAPRVGVEVFLVPILVMPRFTERSVTIDVGGVPTTSEHYSENVEVFLPYGGFSVHYRVFDETPLTLRLFAGFGPVTVTYGAQGTFPGAPSGYAQHFSHAQAKDAFWTPVFGPEIRFGYRVAPGFLPDVGVSAVFYFLRASPPEEGPSVEDETVRLPPGPALSGGIGYALPITIGMRFDL